MARIKNLSSISPFRYPGSKNKLLSELMPYLDNILYKQDTFSDAFVGGGSVLLAVASQYPNLQLFANDKDYWVYCFWKVVASEDETQLNGLLELMQAVPTIQLFNQLRAAPPTNEVECAYRSIFFNRTTFSGIARSGPIGGQEQKSKWTVDCRYNFEKLMNKIDKCHQLLKGRTTVENKDIIEYDYLTQTNLPIYCDPPYMIKGDMLYTEKMNDFHHNKLADILDHRTKWVLSYDDAPEVRELYRNHQIIDINARYCINGKKSSWKEGKNELIIMS